MKIIVLAGGISSEKDVSVWSGRSVFNALQQMGYSAVFYQFDGDIKRLISFLEQEKADCIFNTLHGRYGEDGNIQGVLNFLKIPYTYSGVMASAVAMDKQLTKMICQMNGIPVVWSELVQKEDFMQKDFPYPFVVKPNNEGSGVKVFLIFNQEQKTELIQRWPFGDEKVMVEEYVYGDEFSAGVLDDAPLSVVQICPKEGFYDYTNKYEAGRTEHLVPAPISQELTDEMLGYAMKIHQALGCRGASRSDFRYNPNKKQLVFLEINTQPGLTNTSLLPEMAKVKGISFENLIDYLIKRAMYE